MEFRPCIDIHNGKIKQIVGSSLRDKGNQATENFVSEQDGAFYANFYKKDHVKGGHIILLNSKDSEYYEKTKEQAMLALKTWPGGFQVGGGITAENASRFIFLQNDFVVVNKDFESVFFVDAEGSSQFDWQYDTAQFVNFSNDTCRFHVPFLL